KRATRIQGTTKDVAGRSFDTILYIDVIEHIDDSKAELHRAYDLLAPGGHLLILVPAFNLLYSDFDKAIGHHRRYTKRTLNAELPKELERVRMTYHDGAGMLLSLGNKWVMRQQRPTMRQIMFWDRTIVPVSRLTDKLVFHTFGRSLISVSRKASS
ncbi:MAG TPA: methyltransferase domain-containing protein, partial [Flavobacteriales bacterium]|nr:methyltransferase domain-containing protein [Flavobacteriales bacterium]